jgi:DNA-binding IclR family transcriptional regulator
LNVIEKRVARKRGAAAKEAARGRVKDPDAAARGVAAKDAGARGGDGVGTAYSIGVLDKAMEVLALFTPGRATMTLRQVVQETGFPKTTAFRILSSLVEHRICEFDKDTQSYSLGFELLRLADIRRRQTDIHSVAMPVMRELRDEIQETVVLSVRSGQHRVHIDAAEGLHPMRRTADLGVSAPLHAGAASKVLLAGMTDAEIEDYLRTAPLTKFQKSTITDKKALWKEIQNIRSRGYAESKGEIISGGRAVAAPIRDFSGRTVAVFDILTPEERSTPQQRERCIRLLIEGARKVSEKLGYRG